MESVPKYFLLYEKIRDAILSGRIPAGTRLPSKRSMAEEEGVSLITVEHAYGLLCDEGYVVSRQRSGFYTAFAGSDGRESDRSSTRDPVLPEDTGVSAPERGSVLPFSGEEDFPFSAYARIMRRVLSEYDRSILRRCPGAGCPELRTEIAGYLFRSRGIRASADCILIGSGAEYLYGLIVQLLGRDREFALEDPSYHPIRQVYTANGAVCRMLKLGENGILSEELSRCCAGALHVTPYCSWPSGITADGPKRHEYVRWAWDRGSYIIEDDYDSELVSSNRTIQTIYSLAPDRVIYLNTFTKTMAPSFRIGYMLLPEELMQKYRRDLAFYSCTVPVFDQLVLAEFIAGGELERHISRLRRKKAGGKQNQGEKI